MSRIRVNTVNLCKGFITAHKKLADDELNLIWSIWTYQAKQLKPKIDLNKSSARELLKLLKERKITSWEGLTRSRRKCQELYPETRGELYDKRHKHEKVIKQDVKRTP
jgi:hypothetical protein